MPYASREDQFWGQLLSFFYNAHKGKNDHSVSATDFMPCWEEPEWTPERAEAQRLASEARWNQQRIDSLPPIEKKKALIELLSQCRDNLDKYYQEGKYDGK